MAQLSALFELNNQLWVMNVNVKVNNDGLPKCCDKLVLWSWWSYCGYDFIVRTFCGCDFCNVCVSCIILYAFVCLCLIFMSTPLSSFFAIFLCLFVIFTCFSRGTARSKKCNIRVFTNFRSDSNPRFQHKFLMETRNSCDEMSGVISYLWRYKRTNPV